MNYEPDISLDEPTIRVDGVNHGYISGENVLGDLNIELNSGSFTFLTGPSGSGKTTLLQLLYAAQKPRNGKVSLFGVDTSNATRKTLTRLRRRIGVVYQDFRLLNHLTAYENAALPLRVTGKHEREYRDDVIDLLNWVGLGDRITAKPTTLSGGEQQRVAIARALAPSPAVLIADEPTGNLDTDTGRQIADLLFAKQQERGMTLVLVTHDTTLAARCSRQIRVASGQIAGDSHAETARLATVSA